MTEQHKTEHFEFGALGGILDADAVDLGPARLTRLADAVLGRIEAEEAPFDWAFMPIGWTQGLAAASGVGLVTLALLMVSNALSGGSGSGLYDLFAAPIVVAAF